MKDLSLERPYFEGAREKDGAARTKRLVGQIKGVFDLMQDGEKRTLSEIKDMTGYPEASISAQLRHLRKKRFGGFVVEKEHLGYGVFIYWMPGEGETNV